MVCQRDSETSSCKKDDVVKSLQYARRCVKKNAEDRNCWNALYIIRAAESVTLHKSARPSMSDAFRDKSTMST